MDIDISDILAEVSRPSRSHNQQQQQQQQQPQHYDSSSSYTDHQLLVRHWTSERCSPSLLPYPTALINRVMTRLRDQITKIEDLTSGMDNDNHNTTTTNKPSGNNTNLILSILQTDLSRTQFILRSFLRQRLSKITKHAGYYLKHHNHPSSSLPLPSSESESLLSPTESQFLQHHQALLTEFYDSSFLSSFPINLQRLDDSAGGMNMIEGPDGGQGVVVRCLAVEWGNEDGVLEGRRRRRYGVDGVDDDGGTKKVGEDEAEQQVTVELRFRRGEVWVVRWKDVRDGVVSGDLEVL